jgi:hypothetical protein
MEIGFSHVGIGQCTGRQTFCSHHYYYVMTITGFNSMDNKNTPACPYWNYKIGILIIVMTVCK